jgi:hypothetical protein
MEDSENRSVKAICYIPIPFLETLLLWLTILTFTLMLGSLITPRWVQQGSSSSLWRGSLLRCGGCSGLWEDDFYTSISQQCENSHVEGYFSTFSRLSNAGIVYALFECIGLCCVILIVLLQNGFRLQFVPAFALGCLEIVLVLAQTIAVIGWFGISGARLIVDCSKCSDYQTAQPLCATQGPILAVTIEISIFLLILLRFLLNRSKKHGRVLSETHIDTSSIMNNK